MFKAKVNKTLIQNINTSDLKETEIISFRGNKLLLRHESRNYELEIEENNFIKKTYKIKINGTSYHINLLDELSIKINEMGITSSSQKQINSITAPMPGLILSVNVKKGEKVKTGDVLLVLEAMKMENSITATKNGIIKQIAIKEGTAVEKGQLLIKF
jgi:biotin carboxyl carrier protein